MFGLEIIKGLNEKAHQTWLKSQKEKRYHRYDCSVCDSVILKKSRRLVVNCPVCGHALQHKGKADINGNNC